MAAIMSWITAWELEHGAAQPPPLLPLGSLTALSLVATLAGGYLITRRSRWSGELQALAAGLLLSIIAVDVLPSLDLRATSMWTLEGFACLGLLTYAAVSWANPRLHPSGHQHSRRLVGWSGAAGFLLHRFLEGAAVTAGLLVDTRLAAGVLALALVHWAVEGAAVTTYLASWAAHGSTIAIWLTLLAATTLAGALTAAAVTPPMTAGRAFLAAFCGVLAFTVQLTATNAAAVLGSVRACALAAAGAIIFSLAELAA